MKGNGHSGSRLCKRRLQFYRSTDCLVRDSAGLGSPAYDTPPEWPFLAAKAAKKPRRLDLQNCNSRGDLPGHASVPLASRGDQRSLCRRDAGVPRAFSESLRSC